MIVRQLEGGDKDLCTIQVMKGGNYNSFEML